MKTVLQADNYINGWNNRHAILMLSLSVFVIFTKRIEILSLGGMISFSSLIHRGSEHLSKLTPPGGYANLVTGFRLLLIIVGSFLFSIVSKELLFIIMGSVVVLDVLDGFLARKFNQVTEFGQFFDMEVDALFVLLMCFYYFQYEGMGWWILVPGMLRYVYKVFIQIFPKEGFVETKKRYASLVAGTFFTLLIICIMINLPYGLEIGSLAIVLSFSVSITEYMLY